MLIEALKRMPRNIFVEAIGLEVVNGLQKINISLTQTDLAEILIIVKGKELFKDSGILKSLIYHIEEEDLRVLNDYYQNKKIDNYEDYRQELLKCKWGKNNFSNALLKLFNIKDDSFLILDVEEVEDHEIVIPRLIPDLSDDGKTLDYIPRMYPLHPYQKLIKDKIGDYLLKSGSRLILHMPTGSGKTKTIIEAIIDFWRAKGREDGFIVWLAHSKELCEQSYYTFKDTWKAKGDTSIPLFKVFEKFTPNLNGITQGVLFVGFQKFYAMLNRKEIPDLVLKLRDNTKLVVVDEAHKSIAPTYKKVIEFLTLSGNTRLVGLTATPGRSDDINDVENITLAQLYRSEKITILNEYGNELSDPIKYLQDHEYLARLERKKITTKIKFTDDEKRSIDQHGEIPSEILKRLSQDEHRNLLITSEIEDAVKNNLYPILVFATSISHAIILKILLNKRQIMADCIFGSTSTKSRAKIISSFKNNELPVLINYGVLTTGFDAPNIRTLVIARVTKSLILYSQMLGRALRGPKMGGAFKENKLIDIIDNYGNFGTERAAFNYFDEYFI